MAQLYNLKALQPIKINDLIRIGRNTDAGYVLSKKQIEKTETLLSFGICNDWSFEKHFIEQSKHNIRLYALDASVSLNKFEIQSKQHFINMLVRFLTGNLSQAKKNRDYWNDYSKIAKDFKNFFSSQSNKYFIPKFLGQKDDDLFISIRSLFDNYVREVDDLSIFVKMDIENWEYRTLPQFKPFFNKINGFAIEFHELDITSDKFEETVALLSSDFHVAHIHANNAGGLIYNTNLPMLLEITFINKAIAKKVELSPASYPITGLDFPNIKGKPEISLNFK